MVIVVPASTLIAPRTFGAFLASFVEGRISNLFDGEAIGREALDIIFNLREISLGVLAHFVHLAPGGSNFLGEFFAGSGDVAFEGYEFKQIVQKNGGDQGNPLP